MSTAVSPPKSGKPKIASKKTVKAKKPADPVHPDEYRMTLGEHLEELRMRLILSIIGMVIAVTFCFIFGERVVWYFLQPLMGALAANNISPTVYQREVSETFMVFVKISMITAATIASPWMLYQLWQFIAAGLYEHERKYITKYLPLSIILLVAGMLFLYYLVLPLMLKFFVAFNIGPAIPFPTVKDPNAPTSMAVTIPILQGDPETKTPGTMYFDARQYRLKLITGTTDHPEVRVIPYGSDSIVTPQITLEAYIDMVVGLLLSFGISFQMPLVVLAIVRIGIFSPEQLKAMRQYIYFIISILAAVIMPDVLGGMLALMIPLILLFELGLWLARDPNAPKVKGAWKQNLRKLYMKLRERGMGWTLFRWMGAAVLGVWVLYILTRSNKPDYTAPPPKPAPLQPITPPAPPPVVPAPAPIAPAVSPAAALPSTLPTTMPSALPTTLPAANPAG